MKQLNKEVIERLPKYGLAIHGTSHRRAQMISKTAFFGWFNHVENPSVRAEKQNEWLMKKGLEQRNNADEIKDRIENGAYCREFVRIVVDCAQYAIRKGNYSSKPGRAPTIIIFASLDEKGKNFVWFEQQSTRNFTFAADGALGRCTYGYSFGLISPKRIAAKISLNVADMKVLHKNNETSAGVSFRSFLEWELVSRTLEAIEQIVMGLPDRFPARNE